MVEGGGELVYELEEGGQAGLLRFRVGIGVAGGFEGGGTVPTCEVDAGGDEGRKGEPDPLAPFGKVSSGGLNQLHH